MVTFTVGHLSLTLHLIICFDTAALLLLFICDKELPPKLGKIAETYTDKPRLVYRDKLTSPAPHVGILTIPHPLFGDNVLFTHDNVLTTKVSIAAETSRCPE